MASLSVDKSLEKQLLKILGKGAKKAAADRLKDTIKEFAANKNSHKLDFKKHKRLVDQDVYKIRLLGKNDGLRLMLRRLEGDDYFAYRILRHDELDQ